MELPKNVDKGKVVGRIIDSTGQPVTGKVKFTPAPKVLINKTSDPPVTILPKPVIVDLAAGSFSVELIATDDKDLDPLNWTYAVTFELGGGAQLAPFSITVPEASRTNPIDLTTVIPVAPSGGTTKPPTGGGPVSLDSTTDTATRIAMKPAERTKLDGIAAGATVNATDAALRARGSHTGTQPISTVDGLQAALDSAAEVKPHSHPISQVDGLQAALDGKSVSGHTHSIAQVTGLQAALNGKSDTNHTHNGMVTSDSVRAIVSVTQAAYDAIPTKDPAILYLIQG